LHVTVLYVDATSLAGPLNRLCHHVNRSMWVLADANPTTLAKVVVELEAQAVTELTHGVIGTHAKAVAARQTPSLRNEGGFFGDTTNDLFEVALPGNLL
jgi:hypothetical protein